MAKWSILIVSMVLVSGSGALGQTAPQPGALYSIRSVESGKVVDVTDASKEEGAAVQQREWNGGNNQKWRFQRLPPPDSDFYRIISVNSGKVLDVTGAGQADGDQVIQWLWHDADNQKWRVIDAGNGTVVLQAKHSDKVLDLAASSHEDGAKLSQWTRHGGPNQRWILKLEAGPALKMLSLPLASLDMVKRRGIAPGAVTKTQLDAGQVSVALGESIATSVPREKTNSNGTVTSQLEVAYLTPNAQGEVLDLRPVLQRESQGMRLVSSTSQEYQATIGVKLIDQNSPNRQRPTPEGTEINVFVDGGKASPNSLQFEKTNGAFQLVTLTAETPQDPVVVKLFPTFGETVATDTIPVLRPKLKFLSFPKKLAGWGAGAKEVTVSVSDDAGSRKWSVTLSGEGLAVSQTSVLVTRDEPKTVTVRSVGLGEGKIQASNLVLDTIEEPITLVFPSGFLIASALGGTIGSVLRLLLTKSPSRRVVRNHFVAGILMGLVVAGLFLLGVNITTVPLATQDNPLAVALIAVVGSISLILIFGRLAGMKKLFED